MTDHPPVMMLIACDIDGCWRTALAKAGVVPPGWSAWSSLELADDNGHAIAVTHMRCPEHAPMLAGGL